MNDQPQCILCGGDTRHHLDVQRYGYSFSTVRCVSCGFVSIHPRPDQHAVENLYTMDYFQGQGFDKSINYIGNLSQLELYRPLFEARLTVIESFAQKGTILDAGCGVGDFLLIARERGWNVEGVEISEDAAAVCRKNGITVYTSPLENLETTNRYDCIIMIEVIEHLMNPSEAIANCLKVLKKNGILVVQTGNIDSVYARLAGNRWFYFLYGHLNYFSPKTLGNLLVSNGFAVEKIFYGDEIRLGAKVAGFWKENRMSRPASWFRFLHMLLFQTTRRMHIGTTSAGAMTFYARKR